MNLGFTLKQKFEKLDPSAHAALMKDHDGVSGVELRQFTGNSILNKIAGKHVAFKCNDIRKISNMMIDAGYEQIIGYTEGVIVNYMFLQDDFGTNIELAENKKAKWRVDRK